MILLILFIICISVIVFSKKITVGYWSIKVFNSKSLIISPPNETILKRATISAKDVSDVSAEFIADPFIILHNSVYYMFFEVLDKSTDKGIIGFATSKNGETWDYQKIVLREKFHLSYPYVFESDGTFYMIPESSEAKKVFLYRAINFPYVWEIECELLEGQYVDSSIFQYDNKWWMFTANGGKLHLFISDNLKGQWKEHPQSPLIENNKKITRPGGRIIIENNKIYRYTQDGEPTYGSALRVFKIKKLSEKKYEEEEVDLILSGSNSKNDWRKNGMHSIDQLKVRENNWVIAVDGHKLVRRSYFLWKIERILSKVFTRLLILPALEMISSIDISIF